jgi:hypothetical protein
VKYIANSAAKNMSSDDNQMMVPMETIEGRVRDPCEGILSKAVVAATGTSWHEADGPTVRGWRRGGCPSQPSRTGMAGRRGSTPNPGGKDNDVAGRRWRWPWQRAARPAPLVDDGTLVTVARAMDDAALQAGDQAALGEVGRQALAEQQPVLVRHRYEVLPPRVPRYAGGAGAAADEQSVREEDVAALREVLDGEGFAVSLDAAAAHPTLQATRAQVLTPLSLAQARARATGLEMRYPCRYLGWELAVAGPDPAAEGSGPATGRGERLSGPA